MGPRCQALGVPHPATNRSFSFRVVIQATVSERETDLKDTPSVLHSVQKRNEL